LARRIGKKGVEGGSRVLWRNGVPRPMKMGTTLSPWRYDAATAQAIQPDNQQRTAILRYASWAAVFRISQGEPVTFR
jgi:hypothetical protein